MTKLADPFGSQFGVWRINVNAFKEKRSPSAALYPPRILNNALTITNLNQVSILLMAIFRS